MSVGRAPVCVPQKDQTFEALFSHGAEFGQKFQASMSRMHYTDPSTREWGAASSDRVHKTFYYGNKHIDLKVGTAPPLPRPVSGPLSPLLVLAEESVSYVQEHSGQTHTHTHTHTHTQLTN